MKSMEGKMCKWIIKKMLILYYKKSRFLTWVITVDDHTDIIIAVDEWEK